MQPHSGPWFFFWGNARHKEKPDCMSMQYPALGHDSNSGKGGGQQPVAGQHGAPGEWSARGNEHAHWCDARTCSVSGSTRPPAATVATAAICPCTKAPGAQGGCSHTLSPTCTCATQPRALRQGCGPRPAMRPARLAQGSRLCSQEAEEHAHPRSCTFLHTCSCLASAARCLHEQRHVLGRHIFRVREPDQRAS